MSVLGAIFVLLLIFQIKHFLADYPLQGKFMLGKFSPDKRLWIPALTAHAGVHALFTCNIAQWFPFLLGHKTSLSLSLTLALFDFVLHFTMDRIKASPNLLGRFKAISAQEFKDLTHMTVMGGDHPEIVMAVKNAKLALAQKMRSNTYFWWALGFDQFVHHLTHYAIIYYLVAVYL